MGEAVKDTIITALQVALFIVISGFVIIHTELEEEHKARYEYVQEEMKKQNQELEELRKELRNNNIIMQKVITKEW